MIPTGGTGGEIRFARHDASTIEAAVRGYAAHFGAERIHAVGYERRVLGPAELAALMQREIDQYRAIAEAAHVPMLD